MNNIQYALDCPVVLSCLLGVRSLQDLVDVLKYYDLTQGEKDYSLIVNMINEYFGLVQMPHSESGLFTNFKFRGKT